MQEKAKQGKLGIIAGAGVLPERLIRFCQETGRPFCVMALKNHAEKEKLPQDCKIQWVRIGAVGEAYRLMKSQQVTDIVMIGSVRRPSVREIFPDWMGWRLIGKVGLGKKGDDGLLRRVIYEIEKLGFRVRGIHELMPELLAPAGVWTEKQPTLTEQSDIRRGFLTAKLLGMADVGQSVIVQNGIVLAVEGIEGTKALIERSKALRRKGTGGVLVKTMKPCQETRADMPTIGISTVESAFEAGLKGIAVEADKVLATDVEGIVQKADKLGLFVVGVSETEMLSDKLVRLMSETVGEIADTADIAGVMPSGKADGAIKRTKSTEPQNADAHKKSEEKRSRKK